MASASNQNDQEGGWGCGRVALVTGAGVRLGRKIASALHRQGYKVVLHCCASITKTQELAQELNTTRKDSAHMVQVDLSKDVVTGTARLIEETVGCWGRLDLLVNNAACFFATPILEATSDQWDAIMNLNAKAPYFLMQAAAPHLTCSEGSVVNITDIQGERPYIGKSLNIYCMSKAALIMATKSLALELAPKVRVNYVHPGAAMWPEDMETEARKEWLSKTPLGVVGSGDEVAEAVVFLASPSASYMTGSGISVCGGRSIHL